MNALLKLLPVLRPYWRVALLAPIAMGLEVALDLLQPQLLARIIDEAIPAQDGARIGILSLVMGLAALLGGVAGVGCGAAATYAAQHFGADLRARLFLAIQKLTFAKLDRLGTSSLVTRLSSDVEQVQEAVMMSLRILIRAPLLLMGSVVLATLTCPKLAPLLLPVGLTVAVIIFFVSHKARPLFSALQLRLDQVNQRLRESLLGARLIRALVRGPHEERLFAEDNQRLTDASLAAAYRVSLSLPLSMFLVNTGVAVALWLGGGLHQRGELGVGQLLAFVNYLLQMLAALMVVSGLFRRFSRADASAVRILEVLTEAASVPPSDQGLSPDLSGALALTHVGFAYPGASQVLLDLTASLAPGERVALMGPTGAGKTTLIHLLAGFLRPTQGTLTFDGHDANALSEDAYRAQVGVVLQRATLLARTVAENIRFGRPDATDAEVEAVARLAELHQDLATMPLGYETPVAAGGKSLSGGQRQRLALARALIARPRLLLLDDCTSAVDPATEARILENLRHLPWPCTQLFVTQRQGACLKADRIWVMEGGRLTAGTHDALLATCPLYVDLLRAQQDAGAIDALALGGAYV